MPPRRDWAQDARHPRGLRRARARHRGGVCRRDRRPAEPQPNRTIVTGVRPGDPTAAPRSSTPFARPAQPVNAGFEDTHIDRCPRTWTCRAAGRPHPAANADFAQSGRRALRIALAGEGDRFTLASAAMPALSHRTYTASIWRRSSTAGPAGGESVRLLFYDRRHRLIGSQSNRAGTPRKNIWEVVSAKADAPAGTSSVEVEISVVGTGPHGLARFGQAPQQPDPRGVGRHGRPARRTGDTLSLQVTTPTPAGVHVGTIDAFGEHLLVPGLAGWVRPTAPGCPTSSGPAGTTRDPYGPGPPG